MSILAATALGALMFIVVTMLVPFMGASVESAMPTVANTSAWYVDPDSANTPANTWNTINGFLTIAAIFAIMGLVFLFLRGMI